MQNVACNGDASGFICVEPFGGVSPYEIIWSTGETTFCINNLLPGVYSYTVTDSGAGMSIQEVSDSVTITEPDALSIEFVVVEPSGMLTADGSAEAIVTGGVLSLIHI